MGISTRRRIQRDLAILGLFGRVEYKGTTKDGAKIYLTPEAEWEKYGNRILRQARRKQRRIKIHDTFRALIGRLKRNSRKD